MTRTVRPPISQIARQPGALAALAVAVGLLAASPACTSRESDADLQPPPGFVPPPFHPPQPVPPRSARIQFGEGFFPVESGPSGAAWRWMGRRGQIFLPTDGHPHHLRIAGWVPLELLPTPPTLIISLNGQEIDRFVTTERSFIHEPPLPLQPAPPPTATLSIETTQTARPGSDTRELGVSIEAINWR